MRGALFFAVLLLAAGLFWCAHRDAPEPKPISAQRLVTCLLDRTGFDPYTTTEGTMVGAMRICLAFVDPNLKR